MKVCDISGVKFGRLKVIARAGSDSEGKATWFCRCDCGAKKKVVGKYLRQGSIKSCGCLNQELRLQRNTKHGLSKNPIYKRYSDMIRRCHIKEDTGYLYYGAKGIKVYQEWRDNPQSFINWAINNGFKENLEIDRIDNDGDYSPDNCRWISKMENMHNRHIRKDNTTGYTGVYFNKLRKKRPYSYTVDHKNKRWRKSGFNTIKEALKARNQVIIKNNLPHKIQKYQNKRRDDI